MINYCKTSFVQSIFEVFFFLFLLAVGLYEKKWGKEVAKYQTLPLHLHLAIKSKRKIDEPSRAVLGHARSRWQAEGSWRWDGNSFFYFSLLFIFTTDGHFWCAAERVGHMDSRRAHMVQFVPPLLQEKKNLFQFLRRPVGVVSTRLESHFAPVWAKPSLGSPERAVGSGQNEGISFEQLAPPTFSPSSSQIDMTLVRRPNLSCSGFIIYVWPKQNHDDRFCNRKAQVAQILQIPKSQNIIFPVLVCLSLFYSGRIIRPWKRLTDEI